MGTDDAADFTRRLKAQAFGLGFDLVGITTLGTPATRARFDTWLEAGHQGEMGYLAGEGAELRRDTRRPHAGATHAIVLATQYGGRAPSGPVARYARGDDYHELLRERTRALHHWLEAELGHPVNARPYVDSGPVLERDLAQRAGLGWFGKNTMLINPTAGSFFFLSSLFFALGSEVALVVDDPFAADRCGSCTRCLDACPTQAFTGPRVLDATQCISYLTIELRGAIPEALRERIGGLLYGCDVCQEVCPWNGKFSKPVTELAFASRKSLEGKDARSMALWLLSLSRSEYSTAFKGSPMKRAKLRGLKRNAAVVLGNVGSAQDVPSLISALSDEEPLVRGHAAWALGRIATSAALPAIETALLSETDSAVRAELSAGAESISVRSSPSESK
ncbi:tRNA epoxyqueuosine(34) reductase QueG [Gemmatimonas sp.]|uniref:tRNA epoxyqueuosine(34) reductase QueG n=1 Tax=Gemmatimonas sp. TaxID=1962908 RepID=UPI00286B834C|nr:tRNA epoxyqueuosine(34) reductase QueG [Gemmatimonas sp.]